MVILKDGIRCSGQTYFSGDESVLGIFFHRHYIEKAVVAVVRVKIYRFSLVVVGICLQFIVVYRSAHSPSRSGFGVYSPYMLKFGIGEAFAEGKSRRLAHCNDVGRCGKGIKHLVNSGCNLICHKVLTGNVGVIKGDGRLFCLGYRRIRIRPKGIEHIVNYFFGIYIAAAFANFANRLPRQRDMPVILRQHRLDVFHRQRVVRPGIEILYYGCLAGYIVDIGNCFELVVAGVEHRHFAGLGFSRGYLVESMLQLPVRFYLYFAY